MPPAMLANGGFTKVLKEKSGFHVRRPCRYRKLLAVLDRQERQESEMELSRNAFVE